ncbi:hypothetical protein D3C71_1526410 [compost metagenome]
MLKSTLIHPDVIPEVLPVGYHHFADVPSKTLHASYPTEASIDVLITIGLAELLEVSTGIAFTYSPFLTTQFSPVFGEIKNLL